MSDVPYNASLNLTGALTIEAWVKTGSTAVQQVVERGDWWQNQMSYQLTLVQSKVRLDIMQSNGSYVAVVGSTVMTLNAWHHIAGVYDGSLLSTQPACYGNKHLRPGGQSCPHSDHVPAVHFREWHELPVAA